MLSSVEAALNNSQLLKISSDKCPFVAIGVKVFLYACVAEQSACIIYQRVHNKRVEQFLDRDIN